MLENQRQERHHRNNHRKDTKKLNSIPAFKYFHGQEHSFNRLAKFIIIDKLVNLHGSRKALLVEMFVVSKNVRVQKLKILAPIELNEELRK